MSDSTVQLASADLIAVLLEENVEIENGHLANGAYLAVKLAELFDAGKLYQGSWLGDIYHPAVAEGEAVHDLVAARKRATCDDDAAAVAWAHDRIEALEAENAKLQHALRVAVRYGHAAHGEAN
jgi:hypothetical protein